MHLTILLQLEFSSASVVEKFSKLLLGWNFVFAIDFRGYLTSLFRA